MRHKNNNIVLVGFMGVGKGTLAREMVKQDSSFYAIDTDDMIESYTNTKVKKIFTTAGESAFRSLEQKTANWLVKSVKNAIISTGGGFYKVNDLKKIGTVVYLKADFEWILNRILNAHNAKKKLKKRPLFKDLKKAKKLYDDRLKEYKRVADITIDVSSGELSKIAEKILKEVAKE